MAHSRIRLEPKALILFLVATAVCPLQSCQATDWERAQWEFFGFKAPGKRQDILSQLEELYGQGDIKQLKRQYEEILVRISNPQTANDTLATGAKDLRNRILFLHLWDIRDYHLAVEDDLFETTARWGFYFDVGTLVTTGLATVFPAASTKTALAAGAAFLTGTRLAASKNFLDERDRSLIIVIMRRQRAEQLDRLFTNMKQPVESYPLEQGISDLNEPMNAGSLASALGEFSSAAKSEALQAEDDARKAAELLLERPPQKEP